MNKKAFTLLELAIVLLIIGILSAGAMRMMSGAFTSSKYTRTKNSITLAVKEIADYTVRSRRLPASVAGIISQERDAFNTPFLYDVDDAATTTESICNMASTSLTINVCSTADCTGETITENNVAFILASQGEDTQQQYTLSGTTYTFYKDGVKKVDGVESDDVVGWMTLNTLKAMAGCEGSLGIEQNKLPDAIISNTYSYTLTPKGGQSDYKWCVETDDSDVVSDQLYYGSETSKQINALGGCADADYVTANNGLLIHSNGTDGLNIENTDRGSALVRVKLKDSTGTAVTKDFTLRILREFEVAMDAPPPSGSGSSDPPGTYTGGSDFQSSFGDTASTNYSNASALITSEELKIVQNNSRSAMSVFVNCSPDQTKTNACPKFENKGKFAAYFVYNFTRDVNDGWGTPREIFGYTFAVIKSYKPGKAATDANTTLGLTGDSGPGLGYGDNGWIDGIEAGNSFAVEFDLGKDTYQNDPDNDHLAIVSRADEKKVYWANGQNQPLYLTTADGYKIYNPLQTYVSYAQNIHNTTVTYQNADQYWSHNDAPGTSKSIGKGVYFDSTSAVIPNNFGVTPAVKYALRIEAVSGCNYKCSVCDKQTGRNNFIAVNVWRDLETNVNANSTLKTNMQDMAISHTYNKIVSGTAFPLGNPIMSECIPDDATSTNTLDTIRFGFTGGKWNSSYDGFIQFIITGFKASVTQY